MRRGLVPLCPVGGRHSLNEQLHKLLRLDKGPKRDCKCLQKSAICERGQPKGAVFAANPGGGRAEKERGERQEAVITCAPSMPRPSAAAGSWG